MEEKVLRVQTLQQIDSAMLQDFFDKCKALGFENNSSREAIREDLLNRRTGNHWFLIKDNYIIGMAGCHQITKKAFRIQFRGCELPGEDVKPGLSRSHFNSSTFRELIPFQLRWITDKGFDKNNVYLSVNLGNKNHRAMELIEKQGFLTRDHEYDSNLFLYDTPQTLWKFNTVHYEEVRSKIKSYVV
jgi:hypothetical protein